MLGHFTQGRRIALRGGGGVRSARFHIGGSDEGGDDSGDESGGGDRIAAAAIGSRRMA